MRTKIQIIKPTLTLRELNMDIGSQRPKLRNEGLKSIMRQEVDT